MMAPSLEQENLALSACKSLSQSYHLSVSMSKSINAESLSSNPALAWPAERADYRIEERLIERHCCNGIVSKQSNGNVDIALPPQRRCNE